MDRLTKTFTFLVLLSVMNSCAPTKTVVDTSCPGYKSVDFDRNQLSEEGVGILPVLGGDNKEQYRRPMGDALTTAFRSSFGRDKVLSPGMVRSTLNDNGLSEDYSTAIQSYQTSGIVPRNLVMSLGKALGVRYLLYTKLLADSEVSLRQSTYTTTVAYQIDELYVQCQVWDTQIGDVVWEGKGGCAKVTTADGDMIERTASGLANVVGNRISEGPCESTTDIHKSAQEASNSAYVGLTAVTLILTIALLAI